MKAHAGLLADLDFTGKLDLLTVLPDGSGLRLYRNLGNSYFKENITNSGLPAVFPGVVQATAEDWNNEDVPVVVVSRQAQPPVFFAKPRAGPFVETNSPADWPVGSIIATAALNNDLWPDLAVAGPGEITIVYSGQNSRSHILLKGIQPRGILLSDFDNDGWLDVIADGTALRVWRNDGGNANKQLKLRLVGNRSNTSGLGVRPDPPRRSRTPSGWCTRYGAVDELVRDKDDELVLLNGGDELELSFRADRLPAKPAGFTCDFFL